jgi:hypothetical protein
MRLLTGLAVTLACSRTSPRVNSIVVSPPAAPSIASVDPSSGMAGTAYPVYVTLRGANFADSANVIDFGPVTMRDVRSSEHGTKIVFHAPKEIPSRSEVPPRPLEPGEYTIRVSTSAGTSNGVKFTLTPERAP